MWSVNSMPMTQSKKRASLNADVYTSIRAAVRGPVVIDSVQIEDITFSTQYGAAVEARMQAIVKQQQAEADKQKRIIDADASAYEVKAAADAKAHRIRVQGAAEARCDQGQGRRFARQSRPADTCRHREMEWCAAHHDGAGQRIAVMNLTK